MSATISIVPDTVWSDPGIEGLDVSDDEWRLNVGRYQEFIEQVTGISVGDRLSATNCYRIGNRLQAHIGERKRDGEWNSSLVSSYPDIESLEEFVWIARFFRACHDCYDADEVCILSN